MDQGTALTRIRTMCAASYEPVLEIAELELLIDQAKRPDVDGLLPTDTNWTPTFDLNAAAAAGWRLKAGRVAHRFNFVKDGQNFDVGTLRESFLAMAAHYQAKAISSIPLTGRGGSDPCAGEYVIGNRWP